MDLRTQIATDWAASTFIITLQNHDDHDYHNDHDIDPDDDPDADHDDHDDDSGDDHDELRLRQAELPPFS